MEPRRWLHSAFVADDGATRLTAADLASEPATLPRGGRVASTATPSLMFVRSLVRWIAADAAVLLVSPQLPAQAATDLRERFEAADLPHDGFTAVLSTSGTTAAPKLVPLRFSQFAAHAAASAAHLGLAQDDGWLACLPVHHVGGLSVLLRAMLLGNTVHVRPGFDAAEVNRLLDGGEVTHASLVPTTLARLLDDRGDRPFPASVRLLLVGGAAIPLALRARARRLGVPVAPTYGLSEACSQATTLLPRDFLAGDESAGAPLPGVLVTIRDGEGRPLPEGEAGEIHVAGETIFRGYAGEPAPVTRHATGDWGFLREGRLHVVDRRTDLIVTGGENVAPAAVEEVVRAFPGVVDCGVVGLPDETWGARVVAALEATEDIDVQALRNHCRQALPAFAVPKTYLTVPHLPRTAAGKLRRGALRDLVQRLGS